ncbi:uncharacterized protein EI90DRAFT_3119810 [Cantharellus anzutake]|uniref:uncharacterized protein n=1 Tax=Cantharellus anzutake TaxID=1750568 RepID=UPI001905A62D|nr:uncharacterized protein EI90DRAFT_3119810 [Cantharellus anzutake]KAF8336558.1 hypothetical protein EI90DRAFT_3119810 [Cantharellus anzutake]
MQSSPTHPSSPQIPTTKKFRTIFSLAPSGFGRPIESNYYLLGRRTPKLSQLSYFDDFDTQSIRNMAIDLPVEYPSPTTPHPARILTDDGSWIVRVAENDAYSFTIYVKTPTHHLTLTRTTKEISDLHSKLHEAYPSMPLPPLPEVIRTASEKRRGSFLQTLSRFGSHKDKNHGGTARSSDSTAQNLGPTTPTKEEPDPLTDFSSDGNVGALPEYLTTLANHPAFRTSRPWKRFARVRAEDLQSTRVERQIKRVRSDLAVHTTRLDSIPQLPPLLDDSLMDPFLTRDGDRMSLLPTTPVEETIAEVDEEVTHATTSPEDQDGITVGDQLPEPLPEVAPEALEAKEQTGEITMHPDAVGVDATSGSPATPPESPKEPVAVPVEAELTPTLAHLTIASLPSPTGYPQPSGHARTIRSVSADPTRRLSASAGSDNVGAAVRDGTHPSRSWKPSQPKQVNGLDTDAEAAFDTDVEHPTDTGIVTPIKPRKKRASKKITVNDFEMMRVLGKGCAGKVLLVKHKASSSLYALKAITKRHVLAHQELQHTLTEQAVLKRMAREGQDPFVVKLWWSFHDKENLFLVMDFHPGGDLATQLARWGRLGRDRARFYAAEIVEGVEGLHAAGVVYRDLKPENILIGSDGHIVLTDFGLSKQFPLPHLNQSGSSTDTDGTVLPRWMTPDQSPNSWHLSNKDFTGTFCGTAEYLAPEVIQGLQYSYEVDWWSFGTMLYEMLSGITPFWANNHSDMYVRVLQDELQFPEDKAMDQDTKSLIRGLLQRSPTLRIREPRIKKHPYFSMIDWSHVYYKRYIPPYIPPIDPSNASDTQNFDDAFLDMSPTLDDDPEPVTDSELEKTEDEPLDADASSPVQTPSGSLSNRNGKVNAAAQKDANEETVDVFDGYSYKARQSVILDDDDEYEERVVRVEVEETPALPEVDTASEVTPDDASDISIKASAQPRPPTPAVVQEEPSVELGPPGEPDHPLAELVSAAADLEAALGTPLPASPAKSVHTELTSPEEPASQETVDETKPPIRDLVYDPSPAPSVRFEPPAAVTPSKPSRFAPFKSSRKKRREKPAVSNFDEGLADEETDVPPRNKDEDDDDWDLVEVPGHEETNGPSGRGRGRGRGTSLFARGVVDRYRLAVFKKSTPTRSRVNRTPLDSERTPFTTPDPAASPTPPEVKKRGRTPGLNLRKSTTKFLRAKSPIGSSPTPSASSVRRLLSSPSSSTKGATAAPAGSLTPSSRGTKHSMTVPNEPSLKSKSSALSRESVGTPGSSGTSINDENSGTPPTLAQSGSDIAGGSKDGTLRGSKAPDESDKPPKIFNKKMKVGAEKVMSLFGSPKS